jgi:hypothetical protein
MSDYRAYFIGSDGHIFNSVVVDEADDAAAIAVAKRLIDGHDIELWLRDRKIAKFSANKTRHKDLDTLH